VKTFPVASFDPQSGDAAEAALAAPVELTEDGKRKFVVMSAKAFDQLDRLRAFTIADAPEHINDELMEALQDLLDDADAAPAR
jgi:hypothetical protein